ncbi:hypothetical protein PQD71_gp235 [Kosakonia phage Kc263]|uniref:Uncharacterized protein n=1 Tax=Kosakonia phage Kc263 TaxID=2863194 RepID=A0AAE8BEL7_9CAUD|nr:hypothetical protein PQD71_gp235 [Kosakonia phage Kc263]QYN80091.1 hypothetical protein [Kosakonia phage Kc263]
MTDIDIYKQFARFRVLTMMSIKSKRSAEAIFKDIDKEMVRLANTINKSYTLGPVRITAPGELYRPYRYFNITHTDIEDKIPMQFGLRQVDIARYAAMTVVIARNDFKIEINDENWSKFFIWATKWKVARPKTLEECEDNNFYTRWW